MSESESRSTTDGAGDVTAGRIAAEAFGDKAIACFGLVHAARPMPRSSSRSASLLVQAAASVDVMMDV